MLRGQCVLLFREEPEIQISVPDVLVSKTLAWATRNSCELNSAYAPCACSSRDERGSARRMPVTMRSEHQRHAVLPKPAFPLALTASLPVW